MSQSDPQLSQPQSQKLQQQIDLLQKVNRALKAENIALKKGKALLLNEEELNRMDEIDINAVLNETADDDDDDSLSNSNHKELATFIEKIKSGLNKINTVVSETYKPNNKQAAFIKQIIPQSQKEIINGLMNINIPTSGTESMRIEREMEVKEEKVPEDVSVAAESDDTDPRESYAEAIAGLGDALSDNVDSLKSDEPLEITQGVLNIASSVLMCLGPEAMLIGAGLSLVSGILSLFGSEEDKPSMGEVIADLLQKQLTEIKEYIKNEIGELQKNQLVDEGYGVQMEFGMRWAYLQAYIQEVSKEKETQQQQKSIFHLVQEFDKFSGIRYLGKLQSFLNTIKLKSDGNSQTDQEAVAFHSLLSVYCCISTFWLQIMIFIACTVKSVGLDAVYRGYYAIIKQKLYTDKLWLNQLLFEPLGHIVYLNTRAGRNANVIYRFCSNIVGMDLDTKWKHFNNNVTKNGVFITQRLSLSTQFKDQEAKFVDNKVYFTESYGDEKKMDPSDMDPMEAFGSFMGNAFKHQLVKREKYLLDFDKSKNIASMIVEKIPHKNCWKIHQRANPEKTFWTVNEAVFNAITRDTNGELSIDDNDKWVVDGTIRKQCRYSTQLSAVKCSENKENDPLQEFVIIPSEKKNECYVLSAKKLNRFLYSVYFKTTKPGMAVLPQPSYCCSKTTLFFE